MAAIIINDINVIIVNPVGETFMFQDSLRESLTHVGIALREPEAFALRWHRGEKRYPLVVWAALAGTAIVGTTTYGMTMGLHAGAREIGSHSLLLTLAAGLAWSIPLPALYILNSLAGSRLRASTTLLAALVTTSWGGLALMASIPINWFFTVALWRLAPETLSNFIAGQLVLLVNLTVFAGVGVSMVDVFGRIVEQLEPSGGRQPTWFLVLVGAIGSQLFYLFQLFA
jgi:hypothetical protein